MPVEVVPYREEWPTQFEVLAAELRRALVGVTTATVEHVGSTSVPGLAAKPIIDIDVIVDSHEVPQAIVALESLGYVHRGDLGVEGREAFEAPDIGPRRNVYVCQVGSLSVRNHLATREVLRRRDDLREEYAAVKQGLAADPDMNIGTYIAAKSGVLQRVLVESTLLTDRERQGIDDLNRGGDDRGDCL